VRDAPSATGSRYVCRDVWARDRGPEDHAAALRGRGRGVNYLMLAHLITAPDRRAGVVRYEARLPRRAYSSSGPVLTGPGDLAAGDLLASSSRICSVQDVDTLPRGLEELATRPAWRSSGSSSSGPDEWIYLLRNRVMATSKHLAGRAPPRPQRGGPYGPSPIVVELRGERKRRPVSRRAVPEACATRGPPSPGEPDMVLVCNGPTEIRSRRRGAGVHDRHGGPAGPGLAALTVGRRGVRHGRPLGETPATTWW